MEGDSTCHSDDSEDNPGFRAEKTDSESGEDVRIRAYSDVFNNSDTRNPEKLAKPQGFQDRWSLFAKVVNDSNASEENEASTAESEIELDDEDSIEDIQKKEEDAGNTDVLESDSESNAAEDITADFETSDDHSESAENQGERQNSKNYSNLNGSWADWAQTGTPSASFVGSEQIDDSGSASESSSDDSADCLVPLRPAVAVRAGPEDEGPPAGSSGKEYRRAQARRYYEEEDSSITCVERRRAVSTQPAARGPRWVHANSAAVESEGPHHQLAFAVIPSEGSQG